MGMRNLCGRRIVVKSVSELDSGHMSQQKGHAEGWMRGELMDVISVD